MWLIFVYIPTLSKPHDPHIRPEMILSEPSIIIIWTYQDRMEWMRRILVGEMAGADEDFGMGVGKIWSCG
jgi:hypothetical protein